MDNNELIIQCKKMINRLISNSRKFCDTSCIPDGLINILMLSKKLGYIHDELKFSNTLSYDYDYFAFIKSTKSLIAIRELLNCKKDNAFCEESFMLVRSIFENHILSRYVRENIDNEDRREEIVKNFILAPLGISFNYYISHGRKGVYTLDNKKIGDIMNPRSVRSGKEIEYYDDFYSFLCQYTHCSFGALPSYYKDGLFSYKENDFSLLAHFFAIFVFTKIYEGVVTVNGEDLINRYSMKSYYDLAYDSLELQEKVIVYLIDFYKKRELDLDNLILQKYISIENIDSSNMKIVRMLEEMYDSLFDYNIGSLDKSNFNDGKFKRKYQEW